MCSAEFDVTINQQEDTFVTAVNYSNFTIGSTNFAAPLAPNGSDFGGIVIQANVNPDDPMDPLSGVPAAVNVLTPIAFSGDYTLSYDVWISVPNDVVAPYPTNGSTEQLLWGVGANNMDPVVARNTRLNMPGPVGTWGWLAGENGYGTDDAVIFENATELNDLGDTQLGEEVPFNTAFDMPVTPTAPNNAPANQWVEVDIVVTDMGGGMSNVQVNYNDVEFFSEQVATSSTEGFAMLGYEDPFGSVANYNQSDPNFPDPVAMEDWMWGLFDNFRVTRPTGEVLYSETFVPEPSSTMLVIFGLLGLTLRRR
jgi:hypothetical protein